MRLTVVTQARSMIVIGHPSCGSRVSGIASRSADARAGDGSVSLLTGVLDHSSERVGRTVRTVGGLPSRVTILRVGCPVEIDKSADVSAGRRSTGHAPFSAQS
jgi:hypothetical protein